MSGVCRARRVGLSHLADLVGLVARELKLAGDPRHVARDGREARDGVVGVVYRDVLQGRASKPSCRKMNCALPLRFQRAFISLISYDKTSSAAGPASHDSVVSGFAIWYSYWGFFVDEIRSRARAIHPWYTCSYQRSGLEESTGA